MNRWVLSGVLALLLVSHWAAYEHGRSVEVAQAGQQSAKWDSGALLAEVIGERAARQEEHRGAEAQQEARVKGHEERQVADAGAVDAQLVATVGCSGTDTAAVTRGETATRAAMVLSELLSRSIETNRELASAYDRASIAGKQCERETDALSHPG